MRWLGKLRIGLLFSVLLVTWTVATKRARADFVFGPATNLGSPFSTASGEGLNCISVDGREMYLGSLRTGTVGNWDLWRVTRDTTTDDWGEPANLGPTINTPDVDACACISADGLELYFSSNRSGGCGSADLWITRRPTTSDEWGQPENLGPIVNSPHVEFAPWVTADGLELYFSSRRPGGFGSDDLWVTRRPAVDCLWDTPENLGEAVNSPASDAFPFVTSDGLCLLFSGDWNAPARAEGQGDADMWMARRMSAAEPWGGPVNLGNPVNGSSLDCQPVVSHDGSVLYFCSERPGGYGGIYGDIYQSAITPVVDFNADGVVDIEDLLILIEYWGQSELSVDIGPMPWGDGVVDANDVEVLMRYWGQQVVTPAGMAP
jgi:hypothetical protein